MAHEDVVIVPYKDGPYVIRGPVVLQDQDGTSITLNRRTIALCRCGKSRTRPFCDGTHQVIRFRAASSAESPPGPGGAAAAENGSGAAENGSGAAENGSGAGED